MRSLRKSWWLAAALAVAVGASVLAGCGKSEPYAATVDGRRISNDLLLEEVKVLHDHPDVLSAFTGQPAASGDEKKGTASSEVTAAWLTRLIRQEAVDRDFRSRDLEVTAAGRKKVTSEMAEGLGEEWGKLPTWFRDRLVDRQTRLQALLDATSSAPTEAQQKEYYEQNKDAICPSGNLVYHILVATEAEAKKAEASIKGGKSFAEVAKAVSTDPSSASGGLVGCAGSGSFVAEFEKAVAGLKPGQISAPVKTQYGWHVITVGKMTFAAVQGEIERALASQGQDKFGEQLRKQLEKAKISVNERFGTWDKESLAVNPPKAPAPKSRPASTTSTVARPDTSTPTTAPQPTG